MCMDMQRTWISKAVLEKKSKAEGHILSDFMTHITSWLLINQDCLVFSEESANRVMEQNEYLEINPWFIKAFDF